MTTSACRTSCLKSSLPSSFSRSRVMYFLFLPSTAKGSPVPSK
nr:hypothetical protein [Geoglobus ahangari]